MSTTLIFRLSDEEDLDIAADRTDGLAGAQPDPSPDAPPTSFASSISQRPWWRSEELPVEADVARDPDSQQSEAGRAWDPEPGDDDEAFGSLRLKDYVDESVARTADGIAPAAGRGLNE